MPLCGQGDRAELDVVVACDHMAVLCTSTCPSQTEAHHAGQLAAASWVGQEGVEAVLPPCPVPGGEGGGVHGVRDHVRGVCQG